MRTGRKEGGNSLGVRAWESIGSAPLVRIYEGRGVIFPERTNLGRRFGELLDCGFSPKHANICFGGIISLLLEMLFNFTNIFVLRIYKSQIRKTFEFYHLTTVLSSCVCLLRLPDPGLGPWS